MKSLSDFFQDLHKWPEEARRLFAGALFLISIVLIFVLWRQGVTRDLFSISRNNNQVVEKRYDETPEPLRPLVGIAETLGAIKEIFR